MAKATRAQQEQRINELIPLLVQGVGRRDIVQYATKKWGCNSRQVDTYMARARAVLMEMLDDQRASALAEHIEARRLIRKAAFAAGDYRLALEVMRDEAKLWGLYEQRITHSISQPPQIVGYHYDSAVAALKPPEKEEEE